MNSRIYIHGALYITLLLVTCFSSVQGNVIYVRSEKEGRLAEFLYWDVNNWGPDNVMEGFVVESQPRNACGPILRPPSYQTNSTFKWFALIQTDDCSMEVKLNMADNAGFNAVIAYPYLEYKNYSLHHYLSSDEFDSNLTIVAVRVAPAAGEKIKNDYQYFSGCYLQIVPDYPFNIYRYIIPFVIAVGICMMILMLFVIVKYIRERRRNQRNRLSSRHLKQLPVIKFKKGDQYDVCAICLEEYNEGNKLRVLPCSHAYHTKCIDPWLTNNRRTCPICKRKIRLDDESSDSESDSESEALTETTPLLRPLAGRSRQRAPTSNFLRNPVINSNQPDAVVNSGMAGIENSHAAPIRSTLEQQAGLFLQHSVHIEPDNGESDNSSAYSSSAPPFHIATSTEDEQEALNQPSTSGEHTSSLPNVASSALHVEVAVENSRKENMLKDMIV